MSNAPVTSATRVNLSAWLTCAGQIVSHYGLVVVLAWIGFGKYVKMEARVLIEHSPLMSWMAVAHLGGIPVLGAQPGQFLLKDLVLLGVAPWTLGDSLGALRKRGATSDVVGVS